MLFLSLVIFVFLGFILVYNWGGRCILGMGLWSVGVLDGLFFVSYVKIFFGFGEKYIGIIWYSVGDKCIL